MIMETSGVFAASSSCCLRDYRLSDKNMFSHRISLSCLPLVIILFYLVWWRGLVFSVSVIKIFKGGSLEWLIASSFLLALKKKSISTFDLPTVQHGVDGKLDAGPSLSNWDPKPFKAEMQIYVFVVKGKKKQNISINEHNLTFEDVI